MLSCRSRVLSQPLKQEATAFNSYHTVYKDPLFHTLLTGMLTTNKHFSVHYNKSQQLAFQEDNSSEEIQPQAQGSNPTPQQYQPHRQGVADQT